MVSPDSPRLVLWPTMGAYPWQELATRLVRQLAADGSLLAELPCPNSHLSLHPGARVERQGTIHARLRL